MPAPIVAYWEGLPVGITFGLTVLTALLLATAIWWLWWWLPKREAARLALKIRDAKARADVEDNYRKTIGQALGGIVVLLGAGSAYLQFSQQQRASHDLLISNQVAKGFELLGNKDKDAVVLRLGGIYALEGVMNNSEYYRPVLEALSAFVREGTSATARPMPTPLPTDIQAALTVIARRSDGPGTVDLSKANIAGAKLALAKLSTANLSGANLSSVYLSQAHLTNADLTRADLTNADLTNADLNAAILIGADLTHADLSGADLVQANLTNANLTNADLTQADLFGAFLSGANLTGGANRIIGAKLTRADLTNADLTNADLNAAILIGADLTHADLSGADLTGALLRGANLTGGAKLTRANLFGADLTGAHLDGQKQLDEACGSDAKLPTGLTLKPCPPKSSP
jgi:uncharacterized protein YjbI with pentapeptide repeats